MNITEDRFALMVQPKRELSTTTQSVTNIIKAVEEDLTPVIPSLMYGVVGEPISIYYDGLILAKDPDNFRIEIRSPTLQGKDERRRWTLTPSISQIGKHNLNIIIKNWEGDILQEKSITIKIQNPVTYSKMLNILLVGDSITHQSAYPNRLYKKLSDATHHHVTFVGTHHPKPNLKIYEQPLPEVYHEGYGGWDWSLFSSHYAPGKEAFYKISKSPFIFKKNNGIQLDVRRYFKQFPIKERKPNFVIFYLGLNQTFGADGYSQSDLDLTMSNLIASADKLIHAFQHYDSHLRIGIILPAAFTRSRITFEHVYGKIDKKYGDSWRHRLIHHALIKAYLRHYENNPDFPNVFLIPVNASFDIVDGYYQDDAGHPNAFGAEEISSTLFSAIIGKSNEIGYTVAAA